MREDELGITILYMMCIGTAAFFAVIIPPENYYGGWDEANRWSAYYHNIVEPCVVEEHDDYVVISSIEAAIWQSGERNLSEYNAYIVSNRKWDDLPIIGWAVYRCPDELKLVRIQ
ncbi:MAG: hypothetical protein SVK08_00670 [Halobacteriota archaeon]|nr:hypothetical protein [Halobacteriota archaeon]